MYVADRIFSQDGSNAMKRQNTFHFERRIRRTKIYIFQFVHARYIAYNICEKVEENWKFMQKRGYVWKYVSNISTLRKYLKKSSYELFFCPYVSLVIYEYFHYITTRARHMRNTYAYNKSTKNRKNSSFLRCC